MDAVTENRSEHPAADLIAAPGAWIQHYSGAEMDPNGDVQCRVWHANEVAKNGELNCFCAAGAIVRAYRYEDEILAAYRRLADHLGILPSRIPHWNDDLDRTQAEVIQAMRAAKV